MKTYMGRRQAITKRRWVDHYGWKEHEAERLATGGATEPRVYVVTPDGNELELAHDLYHSPDGFEWGYHGSGPADLARSILKDRLGHVPRCYQQFKNEVVAKLPPDRFMLGADVVDAWLAEQTRADRQPWDADPLSTDNMVDQLHTATGDLTR